MSPLPKHAFPSWALEADKLIWSLCFLAQREASSELEFARTAFSKQHQRGCYASAVGAIAKARAMTPYLLDVDKRRLARRAINVLAREVRKGVTSND